MNNQQQHTPDKSDLLKLLPFDTSLYNTYALTSLISYTVFWLQEWNITTSLENLAVASHLMFPVKFALVGWPQYPDTNRINRTVLQMRPKYRNLATSASGKGVFLNDDGVQEAKSLIEKIGPPNSDEKGFSNLPIATSTLRAERKQNAKPRGVHPEDFLSVIRKSQLFELYTQSRFDEAEAIHLVGMLGVYDHTPSKEKQRKLMEFVSAAKELGDKEAIDFMARVSERFVRYLNK